MNFFGAIKLTFALLFARSILTKLFPEINSSVLGNCFFTASVYYAFIHFAFKQFQISNKDIYPIQKDNKASNYVLSIPFSIWSMFLLSWVLMEIEVLLKEGASTYFQSSTEIFAWSTRQKYFLTTLVISPIFEELYFRGLLLTSLRKKYNRNKAIVLTSLLFGISHLKLDNTFISTLLYSTGSGLFYGWIFNRTNDIRSSIYSHFLWNLTVYIFPLLMIHLGFSIDSLTTFVKCVSILIIISLVMGFFSFKYLKMSIINNQQKEDE